MDCGQTRLLIDCGLSLKALSERLAAVGMDRESLSAIAVTHEHSDHLGGVPLVSQRWGLPVHITEKTREAGERGWASNPRRGKEKGERLPAAQIVPFTAGDTFAVGDLQVTAFSVPHDGADTVAFTVSDGKWKVGVLSDLGMATTVVKSHLRDCDLLLMEFNHDLRMLEDGPYPWTIKQRVKSRHGHLSNDQSAALLEDLVHAGLQRVVLTHLSETNNHPDRALEAAHAALARRGANGDIPVDIAAQDRPGSWMTLG